jgi:hypothetical protein
MIEKSEAGFGVTVELDDLAVTFLSPCKSVVVKVIVM